MEMGFKPTSYHLQSLATGRVFKDTGWLLEEPDTQLAGLVRAVYEKQQLELKDSSLGLFCFSDWLPVNRYIENSSAPVTYKSYGLANFLGLRNLYITFSGWWPEKAALMKSCSFKETEAFSVCGRMLPEMQNKVLVVASAGNTARAFAGVCAAHHIPLLLCVPEDNLDALWFDSPLNDFVKLVCTAKGSDYFDAIHLSNLICGFDGFYAEGGAKNIARRDGMGTTMLSAAAFIGRIPDFYFQAVGSGTGAIAAWEANLRLIADGRFGNHKMRLMVSQNAPFQPIYDAWKAGSRAILPYDDVLARRHAEIITASVLSNRKPPYSVIGGLFDALNDTAGDVLLVHNDESKVAADLFEQVEGIDIHPAAAVAVASLQQAVAARSIDTEAVVMLNITGGGEALFKAGNQLFDVRPEFVFASDTSPEEIKKKIETLVWPLQAGG